MAALERNMQLLKRLCHFSRKLDVVGRTTECRFKSTVARRRLDPLSLFMMKEVQMILRQMSGNDFDKTYRADNKADIRENPIYLLLTKEEMEKELQRDRSRAEQLLQMPPFMEARAPRDKLLSDDPDIAPAIKHKMVFVDISRNKKRVKGYNHRPVVVRHTNGQLTNADWETYDRMCQMFDPQPDRGLYMPRMFEEEHLEQILGKASYRYILEAACVQFEPDNADFIRITRRVYEHVLKHKCFDELRSTRFFGPMIFYFCWIDKIEGLLLDMIKKHQIQDAANVVNLRQVVTFMPVFTDDPLTVVKRFIEKEAVYSHRKELNAALGSYEKSVYEAKGRGAA